MPLQASGRKSKSRDEGFGPRAVRAALGSRKRFHPKLKCCSRDKSLGGKDHWKRGFLNFLFLTSEGLQTSVACLQVTAENPAWSDFPFCL